MWIDGHGSIKSDPAYGSEINSSFLDTLNDYDLEQLLDELTKNDQLLDLLLSIHPDIICHITVVPGISDHKAVTFSINCNTSSYRKLVYLLHKGN